MEQADFRHEPLFRDCTSSKTHKKILKRYAMLAHCYLELRKSFLEV